MMPQSSILCASGYLDTHLTPPLEINSLDFLLSYHHVHHGHLIKDCHYCESRSVMCPGQVSVFFDVTSGTSLPACKIHPLVYQRTHGPFLKCTACILKLLIFSMMSVLCSQPQKLSSLPLPDPCCVGVISQLFFKRCYCFL
jgi:hypothetical protein